MWRNSLQMSDSLLQASEVRKARLLIDSKDAFDLIHRIASPDGPNLSFIDTQTDIPESQKMFSNEIFACNDVIKKLDTFENLLKTYGIEVPKMINSDVVPLESKSLEIFKKNINERLSLIQVIIADFASLEEKHCLLNEKYQIFSILAEFYGSYFYQPILDGMKEEIGANNPIDRPRIHCLLGTINPRIAHSLQRVLLKATHGNIIWKQNTVFSDEDKKKPKVGFTIFFQTLSLKDHIINLCYSFNATVFDVTDRESEGLEDQYQKIYSELSELGQILKRSKILLLKDLSQIASDIGDWRKNIDATSLVYNTLNKMRIEGQVFKAYIWFLQKEYSNITEFLAVKNPDHMTNVQVVSHKKTEQPTYYPLPNSLAGFQYLITSYGIPQKVEINPMIFVLVTFPIFFGLMFGDVGHGLIILVSSYAYLYTKKKNITESEKSTINVIIACSICAIFAGLLYNDVFSKPFFLSMHSYQVLDNSKYSWNGFGIGSKWLLSSNKIGFLNDFKMKMSIIIAYYHQLFGLFLSILNHRNNRQFDEILFSDLPKIILFNNVVGYMVFWIFYKWTCITRSSTTIPPLMPIILDYLMHKKGRQSYFIGQVFIENMMLYSVFLLTMVILCGKPIQMYFKKDKRHALLLTPDESTSISVNNALECENKEQWSTEIIMHFIEAFEFILSIGSNTASYLRIWALSLAHSVLSDIFWMTIYKAGFRVSDYFFVDVIFMMASCIAWQMITLGFMVAMEGISASLHSLRLHWVEFQSKFFKGNGNLFEPIKY
ncbi:MAG: hypothetical protein MHMPM18_001510 [Marteilia pararefringens]